MAGFKRTRYLTCFYCGRKTSTPYTTSIRNFECPSCDATNYLDENGDITDPPVATTGIESSLVQYAVPSASPKSSDTESSGIFCETCLKNQRLFTASLAQYLPGDPDAPDYAELEKKYYRFRKNLEERYPQICTSCEPRVRERMEQAAYTAKTDTLRRMIDRSRKTRQTSTTTRLDFTASIGRLLWLIGLFCQLLWHASVLRSIAPDALQLDGSFWVIRCLEVMDIFFNRLPNPRQLAVLSVVTSLLSIWWNPRFAQAFRGFTKHIIGLPLWYTYQAVTLFIRVLLLVVLGPGDPDPELVHAHVAMHCLGLGMALFVYFRGHYSVQIDTAPLFAPSPSASRALNTHPDTPGHDEDKNLSQILDEILHTEISPSGMVSRPAVATFGDSTGIESQLSSRPARSRRRQSDIQMDSLNLSGGGSAQLNYGEDEMDWTPTQSKHRAFNTYGQREGEGFNEAPIEPKGPFWYHVPPAPTTPAQRMFNPPNQPRLQTSPATMENPFSKTNGSDYPKSSGVSHAQEEEEAPRPVKFAEPKFFAQSAQNDPRNTLSDLFGESFSLSQEEQAARDKGNRGWFGGLGFGGGTGSGSRSGGKGK